jgi:fatty acid-binding protein DegV
VLKRYGVLPTRLLSEGGSLDILVANLGVSYESWLHKKYEKGESVSTNQPSQDKLQGMLDRVRAKKANDG